MKAFRTLTLTKRYIARLTAGYDVEIPLTLAELSTHDVEAMGIRAVRVMRMYDVRDASNESMPNFTVFSRAFARRHDAAKQLVNLCAIEMSERRGRAVAIWQEKWAMFARVYPRT